MSGTQPFLITVKLVGPPGPGQLPVGTGPNTVAAGNDQGLVIARSLALAPPSGVAFTGATVDASGNVLLTDLLGNQTVYLPVSALNPARGPLTPIVSIAANGHVTASFYGAPAVDCGVPRTASADGAFLTLTPNAFNGTTPSSFADADILKFVTSNRMSPYSNGRAAILVPQNSPAIASTYATPLTYTDFFGNAQSSAFTWIFPAGSAFPYPSVQLDAIVDPTVVGSAGLTIVDTQNTPYAQWALAVQAKGYVTPGNTNSYERGCLYVRVVQEEQSDPAGSYNADMVAIESQAIVPPGNPNGRIWSMHTASTVSLGADGFTTGWEHASINNGLTTATDFNAQFQKNGVVMIASADGVNPSKNSSFAYAGRADSGAKWTDVFTADNQAVARDVFSVRDTTQNPQVATWHVRGRDGLMGLAPFTVATLPAVTAADVGLMARCSDAIANAAQAVGSGTGCVCEVNHAGAWVAVWSGLAPNVVPPLTLAQLSATVSTLPNSLPATPGQLWINGSVVSVS